MTPRKKRIEIPPVPPDQAAEIFRRLDDRIREFHGQVDELEMALGMYMIGRLHGWRYLVFLHNKRTIRKYEEILGISIREEFPEEGLLVDRSPAYRWVKKFGQFWKAVSGEQKPPEDRRTIESV